MPELPSDEAFAQYAGQAGLATADQLDEARQLQNDARQKGRTLCLADALVVQGAITASQKDVAVRKLLAHQAGGVKTLGTYKLIKKLGEGGMGAVYLAEDTNMLRKVALKVLPRKYANDPDFLNRFRREAKAAGKLNHVNIVSAFTVGEELGNHYYVMEFCDGEPLDKILKRDGVLDWHKAVEITIQVARGLQHAHQHGFIHRDIKPANIFMAYQPGTTDSLNGVAKILDMGLSKNIGDSDQSFNTQTGMALGTPHYISPEQAKGEKDVDGRTDIYSLGATLYHLLTGQTPFQGTTSAMVIMKHITEQIPNPQDLREGIPDSVVQVIQKMMAKDALDRYGDCAELLEDLQLVIDGKMPSSIAIAGEKSSVAVPRAKLRPADGMSRKGRGRQQQDDDRRSDDRRQNDRRGEPRKDQTIKYVVGGVMALGMLIFLFSLGGNKNSKNTIADKDDPKKAPEQINTTPAPVTQPQPVKADGMVDLLPLVSLSADRLAGAWTQDEKSLQFKEIDGTGLARIQLPYQPPSEYDVRVTFRKNGPDSFVNVPLSKDGRPFHFVLGFHSLCGLENSSERGISVTENPDKVTFNFKQDTDYDCLIKVRNSGIQSFVNDLPLFEKKTNYQELSANPSWALADSKCIGVGAWHGPVTITRIAVRDVTGAGRLLRTGSEESWFASVQKLDPAKQVDAVVAKLRDTNPGWNGPILEAKIDNGAVSKLRISSVNLRDATPLRALKSLSELELRPHNSGQAGTLQNLFPLSGMKLQSLAIQNNAISDISPLKGMPLVTLTIDHNPIKDLSPLSNTKTLRTLDCNFTSVTDHTTIKDLPLKELVGYFTLENDMALLKSMTTLEKINTVPPAAFFDYLAKQTAPKPPAIVEKPAPDVRNWKALFNGKDLDGFRNESFAWHLEDGKIVNRNTKAAFECMKKFDGDVDIRIRFDVQETSYFEVSARGGRYVASFDRLNAPMLAGHVNEVVLSLRDGVSGTLNGTPMQFKMQVSQPTFGSFAIFQGGSGTIRIHSIEYAEKADQGKTPGNDPRWAKAIQLLPLINGGKDQLSGTWTSRDGAMVTWPTDIGNKTKLELPYAPPDEYDFRAKLTIATGGMESADVSAMLTAGASRFVFKFWGDGNRTWTGFENVGGKNIVEGGNPTAKHIAKQKTDHEYTIVVEVRRSGIKGYLDDTLVSEWKPEQGALTTQSLWTLQSPRALGIGSAGNAVTFHSVEVVELGTKGAFLRPEDPAAKEADKKRSAGATEAAPENLYARARIGDWIEYSVETTLNGTTITGTSRHTVTGRTDTDVTLEISSISPAGTQKGPWQIKLNQKNPMHPFMGTITKESNSGTESLTTAGKTYKTWKQSVDSQIMIQRRFFPVKGTAWVTADLPLDGIAKYTADGDVKIIMTVKDFGYGPK